MSSDYEVGYRKPPKHTQFAKGESGNPKGRPSGTKNLRTDLREELAERITVREGERTIKISKQRGIIKSLVARTLKGDPRASAPLLGLILRVLKPDEDVDQTEGILTNEEREVLAALERRLFGDALEAAGVDGTADTGETETAEKIP